MLGFTMSPRMIDFQYDKGSYSGTGRHGRLWRMCPTVTGWRLEFTDPGDGEPTYAGTFTTLHVAKAEADRSGSAARTLLPPRAS